MAHKKKSDGTDIVDKIADRSRQGITDLFKGVKSGLETPYPGTKVMGEGPTKKRKSSKKPRS